MIRVSHLGSSLLFPGIRYPSINFSLSFTLLFKGRLELLLDIPNNSNILLHLLGLLVTIREGVGKRERDVLTLGDTELVSVLNHDGPWY